MKRSMRLLILSAAVLVSLAIPQGCTTGEEDFSSQQSVTISRPEELSAASETDPASQPDPAPATEWEPDDAYLDRVLLSYGGRYEDPYPDRMRTAVLSLFYAEEWDDAQTLNVGTFYSWVLNMAGLGELGDTDEFWNEELGWFFPQEFFEPLVQSYFDVSVEHLRSDELIYHPEDEAYWLGAGPGIGERPFIEVTRSHWDGELLELQVKLFVEGGYMEDEHWILVVRPEGETWKYLSWTKPD